MELSSASRNTFDTPETESSSNLLPAKTQYHFRNVFLANWMIFHYLKTYITSICKKETLTIVKNT